MRQEKLQELKNMIELTKSLVNDDLAITVWSTEGETLYCNPNEDLSINFEVGFKFKDKTDKIFEVMRTGERSHNMLPKEVFGTTIEAIIIPVFDEGKVVGCITSAVSVEKREELEKRADKATRVLEESKNSIYEILNAAINTSDNLNKVNKYVDELEASVSGVYTVVDSIKGNTARTKMLALNASIEAARAGESGKGFKIVANEMGKLSQMSAESVVSINETLGDMKKSIDDVVKTINEIYDSSFKNSDEAENIIVKLENALK